MRSLFKALIIFVVLSIAGYSIWNITVSQQSISSTEIGNKHTHIEEEMSVTKVHNNHSNVKHSHKSVVAGQTDTLEAEDHDITPENIKNKLCIEDDNTTECVVNTELDYSSELLDNDGHLKTDPVAIILGSINFEDVLIDMSSKKISNDAFEKEYQYNDELNSIKNKYDIQSSDIHCNDFSCGIVVKSKKIEDFNKFNKAFFSDSGKGNVFIGEMNNEEGITSKVLFFPGNLNPVLAKSK